MRKLLPDLVRPVGAIQQEDAASHRILEHIDALEKRELVAGDKVGLAGGDQIVGTDRLRAEAQV